MKFFARFALLFACMMCAYAQTVDTGMNAFGSYSGANFGSINNGNLNVHFEIPIVTKPGRGLPFTYTLVYDSSIWRRAGAAPNEIWQPEGRWGWSAVTQAAIGRSDGRYASGQCGVSVGGPPWVVYYTFERWDYDNYVDQRGRWIRFPHMSAVITNGCNMSAAGGVMEATDGSGYKAQAAWGYLRVWAPTGEYIEAPSATGNSGSRKDRNGNYHTVPENGTFTDTLGSTALAITGAGTPANPMVYTYRDASNNPQSITVNYQAYNIRTAFGCSGVADFHLNDVYATNLVSSIQLPNGTSYSFTYEDTPGHSGFKTGRLTSVRLPTGGTVKYKYTLGNNGIICADGSTAGLERRTNDTGLLDSDTKWSYSRGEQLRQLVDDNHHQSTERADDHRPDEGDEQHEVRGAPRATEECGRNVARPAGGNMLWNGGEQQRL